MESVCILEPINKEVQGLNNGKNEKQIGLKCDVDLYEQIK